VSHTPGDWNIDVPSLWLLCHRVYSLKWAHPVLNTASSLKYLHAASRICPRNSRDLSGTGTITLSYFLEKQADWTARAQKTEGQGYVCT